MIFAIVEFLVLLVIGGFIYYFLGGMAMDYLDSQVALYPTAFNTASVTFVRVVANWLLLLMVLGGLYGLFVWVQRTQPGGYYR